MRKKYFFLPIFLSIVLFATSQSSLFSWSFQQPTYLLDKENTKLTSYACDTEKDACKVNFDFTSSVSTDEPSTHYACLIDFWFGPTWEENKCNPNTVEFPVGTWTVHVSVKKIADDSLVTEWTLTIIHPDGSIDPLRVTHVREWQSPSYLTSKDDPSLSEYSCDPEQDECKVNLKVVPMLDGVESSLLSCEITSDFEIIPTSDPCNPNTSIVTTGEHTVTIKILDKTKNTTLQTYQIVLKNNPPDTTIDPTRVLADISWQQPTYLLEKEDTSKNEYICDPEKPECKINLLVTPKLDWQESDKITCHIFTDFGMDENDCNPDTVSVPIGQHTLTLEIKNKATEALIITRILFLKWPATQTLWWGSGPSLLNLSSVTLTVQSGLDESGVCKTPTCQVNFLAEVPESARCEWDFGGGVFETTDTDKKCNPGYVRFSRDATIRLVAYDPNNSSNRVEKTIQIFKNAKKQETCIDCDDPQWKIQISAVLPNPPRADTVEWIEIENISEENISLDWCKIADESRSYKMTGMLGAKQVMRFRQAITWLTLWNTKEKITLTCGENAIDTFSWDFPVPTSYILRRKVLQNTPEQATVVRVIDGDTIDVTIAGEITRLRLLGIDTPETVHPRKAVEKFWKEASNFTRMTLEGKTVWLTFDTEPVDHYGRRLAYIWQCSGNFSEKDCTLFNASIVAQGYARMERRFPFRFYERFIDVEKEAKKASLGIWSDPEVAKTMNALTSDEKDTLASEQEKEYLELQEELLHCEKGEDVCDAEMTWETITEKISTLKIEYKKAGIIDIEGKTWWDFSFFLEIFLGDKLVEKIAMQTDEWGKYETSWIPEKIGIYTVKASFVHDQSQVQKEEKVDVSYLSPHFLVPLGAEIVLQWQKTNNRTLEGDTFLCKSRGTCSLNVTAQTNREWNVHYFWIFPDGSISDKENPTAISLGYGEFTVILFVSDDITGEIHSSTLSVRHTPLPKTAKKSSFSTKYTLDIKEIPEDVGGWNMVWEKESRETLMYQLVLLFLTSGFVYIFLVFKSE